MEDNTIPKLSTKNEINDYGFIIVRNVQNKKNNILWKETYNCIRKFYSNKIIIIDTGSIYSDEEEFILDNCIIINENNPSKAMISAYKLYYDYRWFSKAIILQDSVFIQKYIDFSSIVDIKFIWDFEHHSDNLNDELYLLHCLNDENLINFYYSKHKWYGCFGSMSVIELDFLDKINNKYNFLLLYNCINKWEHWMALERVFSVICTYENSILSIESSIIGDVYKNIFWWGFNIDDYENNREYNSNLPIVKVFSTRK